MIKPGNSENAAMATHAKRGKPITLPFFLALVATDGGLLHKAGAAIAMGEAVCASRVTAVANAVVTAATP